MERELLSDCHDSLSMAGVATDSTTQVSSPLSAAAGLAGQMACEGRAQHMLGGCEYINHGDRKKIQGVRPECPQATASHLGCWLKMQ